MAALLLLTAASAVAAPIAVVTDGTKLRAVFSDLGTLLEMQADGEPFVCGDAFSICTSLGVLVTQDNVSNAFAPGTLEFVSYYKPPQIAIILTQNGTDAATGAPRYDLSSQTPPIPDGTKVYLVIDTKPIPGGCLGVHHFWEITKGECKICVKRKVYNTCSTPVSIFRFKEFFKFCPERGIFDVTGGTVEAFVEVEDFLCRLLVNSPGNVGASSIKAGSVADDNILDELSSCAPTEFFTQDQIIGNRWLGVIFDFKPGYVRLQPAGRAGYEKFFPICLECHCDEKPPGTPCPPCPQDPGNPGSEGSCPLSQGFWKTHSSEWPVNSLLMGGKVYTKPELLAILNAAVSGDASKILGKQLIAAKLNIANGSTAFPIFLVLTNADTLLQTFLGKIPLGVSPASATGQQMVALASTLESYNTNKLTPGCSE
jgi:hypothetical protein